MRGVSLILTAACLSIAASALIGGMAPPDPNDAGRRKPLPVAARRIPPAQTAVEADPAKATPARRMRLAQAAAPAPAADASAKETTGNAPPRRAVTPSIPW